MITVKERLAEYDKKLVEQAMVQAAIKMLQKGVTSKDVNEFTGLSMEKIENLITKNNN